MDSSAPNTSSAAATTAPATDAQAVAPATATQTSSTSTNAATTPISADTLSSALTNATGSNATNAPDATDVSELSKFVSNLLQNQEISSDEKVLQLGEKMLEQTQSAAQVMSEMQELKQRLARFESEQDSKSRQQVEQQVQLLEQALATDPNNPAFAANGITKESLEQFKQLTMKLAPEERDLVLKVNQSIAAFGMNSQITETFESQPAVAHSSHQDELTRLRQQEQEARDRAAMLERQQKQQQLAARFANIQVPVFRQTPMASVPAPMSSSSCASSMSQMFQSARPMSAMSPVMPMSAAVGGGVSNFGSSPSVSQRMSEESFAAAATNNTKRAADTSNDVVEHPAKKTTLDTPVMGRLSNEMALLTQKARLFHEKMAAEKKSKKHY